MSDAQRFVQLERIAYWHRALADRIRAERLPAEMAKEFTDTLEQQADDADHMAALILDTQPRRAAHEAPYLDDLPETRAFDAMVDWHRAQLPAPVAETIETLVGLYGVKAPKVEV